MKMLLLVFCLGQIPDIEVAWDLYFECMDLNLAVEMADGQYNMQRVVAKWHYVEAMRYYELCEELNDIYTLSNPPSDYYDLSDQIEEGNIHYNSALHHYDHPFNPPEPTIGFIQNKQAGDESYNNGVGHLNVAEYSEAKDDFIIAKFRYESAQRTATFMLSELGHAEFHYYNAYIGYREYYMQWSMDPTTMPMP